MLYPIEAEIWKPYIDVRGNDPESRIWYLLEFLSLKWLSPITEDKTIYLFQVDGMKITGQKTVVFKAQIPGEVIDIEEYDSKLSADPDLIKFLDGPDDKRFIAMIDQDLIPQDISNLEKDIWSKDGIFVQSEGSDIDDKLNSVVGKLTDENSTGFYDAQSRGRILIYFIYYAFEDGLSLVGNYDTIRYENIDITKSFLAEQTIKVINKMEEDHGEDFAQGIQLQGLLTFSGYETGLVYNLNNGWVPELHPDNKMITLEVNPQLANNITEEFNKNYMVEWSKDVKGYIVFFTNLVGDNRFEYIWYSERQTLLEPKMLAEAVKDILTVVPEGDKIAIFCISEYTPEYSVVWDMDSGYDWNGRLRNLLFYA